MATRTVGRPETPVSAPVARELEKARKAVASARAATEKAATLMDATIASAYAAGVPTRQIALRLGITRKTVYTSLQRSGIDAA